MSRVNGFIQSLRKRTSWQRRGSVGCTVKGRTRVGGSKSPTRPNQDIASVLGRSIKVFWITLTKGLHVIFQIKLFPFELSKVFDVRKEKNSFPYHLRISFCAKEGFLGASSTQHVALECSSSVTFLSLSSLLEHIFHRYQRVGPNMVELMAVQNI